MAKRFIWGLVGLMLAGVAAGCGSIQSEKTLTAAIPGFVEAFTQAIESGDAAQVADLYDGQTVFVDAAGERTTLSQDELQAFYGLTLSFSREAQVDLCDYKTNIDGDIALVEVSFDVNHPVFGTYQETFFLIVQWNGMDLKIIEQLFID